MALGKGSEASWNECASLPEELVLRWIFPVTGLPHNSPHWSQEAEGHCVATPCAARGLGAKPGSAWELRVFCLPRGGRTGERPVGPDFEGHLGRVKEPGVLQGEEGV